jgi:BCD family chlorophyll transporter-like MFS transporter
MIYGKLWCVVKPSVGIPLLGPPGRPRFLPFADAATPTCRLSRLLRSRCRCSRCSVGMALVLLVGTLNRVMIVELKVPATLVAVMVSLPVLYAPLRALIGFRSDTHRSALGWRRVPFIWMGTMMQFGGLAVMPFALLVLSGGGKASRGRSGWARPAPACASCWWAQGCTPRRRPVSRWPPTWPPSPQPKVVGLMYVMLLAGTIVSAFVFGAFLRDFSAPAVLFR